MEAFAFFRADGGIWNGLLPPGTAAAARRELYTRRWEVLVLNRRGAAALAEETRMPVCRTVLLPREAAPWFPRARQTVDWGLSGQCSLTLSSLARPVLCVQRRLTAANGREVEPQELPLPGFWAKLPPEHLLPAAGMWLLTAGRLPEREIK